MSNERPKCTDLMDAIRELKWWLGVSMARLDCSSIALAALFGACSDFERKYRGGDADE